MTETLSQPRSLRVAIGARRLRNVLQARSIDAVFMSALQAGPFDGRVHSVFHSVVNLERASGELVTLAARALDNAPGTAIVDVADFADAGIKLGDAFMNVQGELRIGQDVAIPWAAAPIWQASLPRYAAAQDCMSVQLHAARSYLARHGVQGAMFGQPSAGGAYAAEITAALQRRSTSLIEALAQARQTDACQHAVSMVGLGPGLTPSGDDFLVGLFAVLNIAGSPCCGWLDGGTAVLLQVANSTHAISLAALTAAAEGRVRESIAALIESLMHGTPDTLVAPLSRVLAIGSTSGADIVEGILAGLELNLHVQSMGSGATHFQPVEHGRRRR